VVEKRYLYICSAKLQRFIDSKSSSINIHNLSVGLSYSLYSPTLLDLCVGKTLDHQVSQIGSDGGHLVVILLENYIPNSHGIKGTEPLEHLWYSNVQLIEKLLNAIRRALGEARFVDPTRWQKGS